MYIYFSIYVHKHVNVYLCIHVGVRFYSGLLNKIIPNYGMVSEAVFREADYGVGAFALNDVGEDDGLNDGLWCQSADNTYNIGTWEIPDATVLQIHTGYPTEATAYVERALGQIGLLRRYHLTFDPSSNMQGMYRCVIPDENDVSQMLVLWIGVTTTYLNITSK